MADPDIRQLVHSSFRDSGFPEGKLHFRSFLSRTPPFRAALSAAAAIPEQALIARLDSVIDLEFYMPVPEHRLSWNGDGDLFLAALLDDDGSKPIGYDLDGTAVDLSPESPPSTPTVVLVPVETDFSGAAASANTPALMQFTDGAYLTYMYVPAWSDYEGWGMGNPEFEVHAYLEQSSGAFTDASCSGEQQDAPLYFHYDGTPSFSGSVLVASKSIMESGEVQLQVWEDDTDPCTSSGGRPVSTNSLSQEDLQALALLSGAIFKAIDIFDDSTSTWRDYVLAGFAVSGATYATADSLQKDDHVGVIQWPPNGCWSEATGAIGASIEHPQDGNVGVVKMTNTFGTRDPICDLSVFMQGPSYVETCPTWVQPDPAPNYSASVTGGSGTISYEWYEDGILMDTGSSYTLNDLSDGEHSVEVRVQRGTDFGSEGTIVTVNELAMMDC